MYASNQRVRPYKKRSVSHLGLCKTFP
jgi:hypothetical protein